MNDSRVRVQSRRLATFPALERNVVAVAGAMFLLGFGEELWKRFVPKYLEALGAPVLAIGLYGTVRDLLDGVCQYPGGWIADHFGRRRALTLFVSVATVGYTIYWLAPSWPFVFAVQMATSILVYIPAAHVADRAGRKPFVIATFLAFSLFPLAVVAARGFGALLSWRSSSGGSARSASRRARRSSSTWPSHICGPGRSACTTSYGA